jgi:hypothetical protein
MTPVRVAALVGVLGVVVMFAAIPCGFHALTGVRCPFCGMTRASVALAQGDFAGALAAHPLAPVVLVAAAWAMWTLARGRIPRVPATVLLGAVALVWVVNVLVR